jgi:uncharacterized membrane protein
MEPIAANQFRPLAIIDVWMSDPIRMSRSFCVVCLWSIFGLLLTALLALGLGIDIGQSLAMAG